MDDTNQNTNQPQKPGEQTLVSFGKQSQTTQPPVIQKPEEKQKAPSAPFAKEQEPIPSSSVSGAIEYVAASETAPEIERDLEEIGVQETSPALKLSPDQKAAGLREAKETTPVNISSSQSGKYPLTQAQAQQTVKGQLFFKDSSDSMLWLAMLILRQLQIKEKDEKKESK